MMPFTNFVAQHQTIPSILMINHFKESIFIQINHGKN